MRDRGPSVEQRLEPHFRGRGGSVFWAFLARDLPDLLERYPQELALPAAPRPDQRRLLESLGVLVLVDPDLAAPVVRSISAEDRDREAGQAAGLDERERLVQVDRRVGRELLGVA